MVRMFQEKMADDGVLMSEGELDGLLGEIGGACTYDNMVRMFQEKMAGDGNDSDVRNFLHSRDSSILLLSEVSFSQFVNPFVKVRLSLSYNRQFI